MMETLVKILVALIPKLIIKLYERIFESKKENEQLKIPKVSDQIEPTPIAEWPSTTIRLKQAVDIIFEHIKYPLDKVAYELGLNSETAFKELLNGTKEPKFEFLERFALQFGVNKDWLISGEGTLFRVGEYQRYATGYLDIIINAKPESVYLIRENSETGRTGIVLKLDQWNYQVLEKYYHLSSEVGRTGQNQIKSFYNFIKKLKSRGLTDIIGKHIDKESFSKLFNGNYSPKFLEKGSYSYWYEHFQDYEHKYPDSKYYGDWYGSEFLDAQRILKYTLAK
ncbi:MAG: hypothetical protein ACOCXH_14310 [Cyclobacteriaceae bacterium]